MPSESDNNDRKPSAISDEKMEKLKSVKQKTRSYGQDKKSMKKKLCTMNKRGMNIASS